MQDLNECCTICIGGGKQHRLGWVKEKYLSSNRSIDYASLQGLCQISLNRHQIDAECYGI